MTLLEHLRVRRHRAFLHLHHMAHIAPDPNSAADQNWLLKLQNQLDRRAMNLNWIEDRSSECLDLCGREPAFRPLDEALKVYWETLKELTDSEQQQLRTIAKGTNAHHMDQYQYQMESENRI